MTKPVNITLVTFNRLEFTKKCIDSIYKHTKYPFELTIVDNNSHDETRAWLKENDIPHVAMSQNLGIGMGYNYGWHFGSKDYFLKLDNDITIKVDHWLEKLVEVLDQNQEVGIVGYNVEGVNYPSVKFGHFELEVKPNGQNVNGACMLVPKRTLDKLGYFYEDYWEDGHCLGGVDSDYGYRNFISGNKNCYLKNDKSDMLNWGAPDMPQGDCEEYYRERGKRRKKNRSPGGQWFKNITTYNAANIKIGTKWADPSSWIHEKIKR